MSERDNSLFEQAVEAVRNDAVEPAVVEQAAARVLEQMGGAAQAAAPPARLVACDGFRGLFVAYLDGSLNQARRMLLEDHLHECVACRQAMETARGKTRVMGVRRRPASPRVWGWAAAAVFVVSVAAGTLELVSPPGARAVVESVEGGLYLVSAGGTAPLAASAATIAEGAEVRTGRGGHAVLRLADGSRVEMSERTTLAVRRGWFRTAVALDKGDVIVQAARQGWIRRLEVATSDARATVKGTIFAVSAGEKGTRVSVLEGAVQVDAGQQEQLLRPGDQATSNPALLKTPVRDQVAWSRDRARYLALLGEVRAMSAKLEALPGPGLRYRSRLAPLVPTGTVFVAAIPNPGGTLANLRQVFDDRLKESSVLREWWQQQGPKAAEFDRGVEMLRTLSSYLGDEVIVAMPRQGGQPLVLAEARNPGLRQFVASEMARVGAPSSAIAELDRHLMIAGDIAAASPDPAALEAVKQAVAGGGATGFLETPFGKQIAQAYAGGASWLFCADLEQIVAKSVPSDRTAEEASGLRDVRYLTIERKDAGGWTESAATLGFSGPRRGIASWLGTPAKMGALEFVSADTVFAAGMILKNPDAMLGDLAGMARSSQKTLPFEEIERQLGVRIREDVAQALGSELAVTVEAPLAPTPNWKVIVEVYDANRIDYAIGQLVKAASEQQGGGAHLELTREQAGGRDLRHLAVAGEALKQVWYTFADGYLVISATREGVLGAIQHRETGISLARSDTFKSRLPRDGQASYSAVLYEHVGPLVAQAAGALNSTGTLSAEQQQLLEALGKNNDAALVYVYGEADRIRLGTTSNLLGVTLDSMLAFGKGPGQAPARHVAARLRHGQELRQ